MDTNILSIMCYTYLLLGGFLFILFMIAWWLEVLNFNEVKYINHLKS